MKREDLQLCGVVGAREGRSSHDQRKQREGGEGGDGHCRILASDRDEKKDKEKKRQIEREVRGGEGTGHAGDTVDQVTEVRT